MVLEVVTVCHFINKYRKSKNVHFLMDKPAASAPTGAKEKVDKQARQLAYDTRYKVRQSFMKAKSGGQVDPATVKKSLASSNSLNHPLHLL